MATLDLVSKVRMLTDDGCSVLIDETFSPVVIVSFYGVITKKLLLEFVAWYREYLGSLRPSQKFVMINDPRGVPTHSPTLRKIAAEEMQKFAASMKMHNLHNILIIDNALLRGAITAIGWLINKDVGYAARDMHDAITVALRALTSAGLPLPVGLEATSYRAPRPALNKLD
jgi:hypothetical protein